MPIYASTPLKFSYVLVLLMATLPWGIGQLSHLQWSDASDARLALSLIVPLGLLLLGMYRVFTVLNNPYALCSYKVRGGPLLLRRVGVVALHAGALIGVIDLLIAPFVLPLFIQNKSGIGIEYFVSGLALLMFRLLATFVGALGLVCFEWSRLIGLEQYARVRRRKL